MRHYNFYRTYDPNTGRYLEAEAVQPSRQERALDGIEEIQGQRFGEYIRAALLPHVVEHAGAVDATTGRPTELGSSPVGSGRWSQYAYAGNEPLSWIDPLGDSKTKGIQTGADSYLHRFRAAQGDRAALCAIDDEVEQLWKLRDASMPKARYRKAKAWFKLAKRNQLRALVPPVCVATSLCACAEQPESCAAMFDDQ